MKRSEGSRTQPYVAEAYQVSEGPQMERLRQRPVRDDRNPTVKPV